MVTRRLDRAEGGKVWNGWDSITTRFLFLTSKLNEYIYFQHCLSSLLVLCVGLIYAAVVYSMIQHEEVVSRDVLRCLPATAIDTSVQQTLLSKTCFNVNVQISLNYYFQYLVCFCEPIPPT